MSTTPARGRSRLRDLPLIGWLVAAVLVALGHRWLRDSNWLLLHLVLLGAISHSILVWSLHFTQTLLRVGLTSTQARQHTLRLGLLTAGAVAVVVGVPATWWPLTLAGGCLVAAAVGWHGLALLRMLRVALPARFRVSVRYYLAAAGCLLVGVGLGVTLAWHWPDPWYGRLLAAHALVNLLGWVGLTVFGTLLTLWPTMLRTRMDAVADRWTQEALPVFVGGVAVAAAGALLGLGWVAAAGVVVYLGGVALWGRSLWRPARTAPPREFAAASVAAGLVWLVIGLGWAGWLLATADWAQLHEAFLGPAAALAAGMGVQVLIGSLSYLLPSVLGGGPSVVRAGQTWFNAGGGFRLVVTNGGLALWLLPTPSWVKVAASSTALLAAAAFLPLMILGLRASIAARKQMAAAAGGSAPGQPEPSGPAKALGAVQPARPTIFTAGQLIAGFTALATVVVVGVGVDPAVVGVSGAASGPVVAATGRTVQVDVTAQGMRFTPGEIHLAAGDRLVVTLINADTTTHDLVIGAARTARIAPGARTELDAGVIGASAEGCCSVAGHRQLGMVLQVVVDGAAAPAASAGHDMGSMTAVPSPPAGAAAAPSDVVDPTLPPLTAERVHRLTFTVTEVPLEVAPGVWQKRWTFNGGPVGPTLHGRVGDRFEITLVNDGSMGHSIDFHAGALAPDGPMRTIEPGQRLTYSFTATKAGIWMYHCSTMPMSAHIAAGMAGAVVIEPDDLAEVDRSYFVVQSEVYLGTAASNAAEATEVDADAAASGQPDYVVFNGLANGYDGSPLAAKTGERVRFWVLNAGPNRTASFHVVGAHFDTVFKEGGYLLKRGRDAFGGRNGGAQALDLAPAQGGFVEATFAEAGHYPMVSHVMADAERGAHGVVAVEG